MQKIKITPNPHVAAIFQGWSEDWSKEAKAEQKDSANQFHTVYKIAGELFTKGGELDANVVSALYNDCKQKVTMSKAMVDKVKSALTNDEEKAELLIKKINTTAQDAAYIVKELGQQMLEQA
ncbi:TPA: hypothetical protein ACX6QP_000934 [Photobacterium damselae]